MPKTYDLIYDSATKRKIHSRVWKELPEGLIKARLSNIVQDRKEGIITLNVIGTIEDGTRIVMSNPPQGGDPVETEVPKYLTVLVKKVIAAKGVKPRRIQLRLVDADTDFRYDHKRK